MAESPVYREIKMRWRIVWRRNDELTDWLYLFCVFLGIYPWRLLQLSVLQMNKHPPGRSNPKRIYFESAIQTKINKSQYLFMQYNCNTQTLTCPTVTHIGTSSTGSGSPISGLLIRRIKRIQLIDFVLIVVVNCYRGSTSRFSVSSPVSSSYSG